MRNLVGCTIVIVLSMTLQVPLLSLSLVIVFFVSQSNIVLTKITGVLFVVGATAAVAASIILLKFTYGYPLLRLLGASLLFAICMFAMRATRLGPIFFIIAIITIFVQSQVDVIAQPETLVRLCLWVWVAVVYPIIVMLIINTALLTQEPDRQLSDTLERQLGEIIARLNALMSRKPYEAKISPAQVQLGLLSLHKLLKFSSMRKVVPQMHEAKLLNLITAVSRLYAAVANLQVGPADIEDMVDVRNQCSMLAESIHRQKGFSSNWTLPPIHECSSVNPGLNEMCNALKTVNVADNEAGKPPTKATDPLLASDAFSNRNYLRFAVKTWLAAFICYVFYSAVDWPGIHTSMLTCVIVALPSLGAAAQKGLLRLCGCLLGCSLAIASAVFVIPLVDDITGLLLMSLPIIGLGAWISAGSERVSYAGVQIMFCFALALLDEFGPTTDLTEIRDRIIGVVLGLVVSTVIQALLWPERESDVVARKLSDALSGVVERLRLASAPHQDVDAQMQALNLRSAVLVSACESLLARVALEPGWRQDGQENLMVNAQTLLSQTRDFHLLSDQFIRGYMERIENITKSMRETLDRDRESIAKWLECYIACLRGNLNAPEVFAKYPKMVSNVALLPLARSLDEMARLTHLLPRLEPVSH